MSHDRTYRPVLHAPAPRLRDADGSVRQVPRRYARYAEIHPVPPLKGLPGTRTTDVSNRALAPGGAGIGHRICTGASVSRLTAHYSLLTANSTFTFSAKEKDSETGLSYFGSRYYSSDLSVWLSVDPMSDKYASLSPYVYCADNPVKLVDPNGEEIDPESLSLWNSMRSSLNNEKFSARIGMIIEKATHGILCEGASNRYLAIDITLTTMETMEGSSQVYKLSRCKGAVSSVKYDKKDNSLTVNFSSTSGFIHEITHCGQFEKGWIGFSRKSGLVFSDIFDELEAYRNQSWYDPSSLPFVSAINPFSEDWVRNIYDGKKYPYKKCGLFPTNRDSTMEDIRKAYPGLNWTFSGTISNAYKKLFYFKPKSVTEKS